METDKNRYGGIALREREEFLRQNQQDPGPNSGSDDPSDSA